MERKLIKGKKLNKNNEESNDITQIVVGSLLLLVGIALGMAISINGTFALDTSTSSNATSSNATSSNATSSNATSPNATSSNATSSNATTSNATSGNIYLDNNKIYLDKFDITKKEAKLGEKVEVDLCTNINITSAKLLFKSNKGNQFTIYLSNLNNDEYMEIPSNVTPDTYYLSQLIMESNNIKTTYVNGNDYNFNIELKIIKEETSTKVYNNEEVNENTIKEITTTETKKESKKEEEQTDITINATGNSIISKEVFNSIKGTDKKLTIKYQDNELIFNGRDIKEAKDIDVTMKTTCITDDDTSKLINNNGYIVNFASNGELPGKEIVRVKATTEMKNYFGNKKLYVYYYDEINNKFTLIARNVTLENDYYEFAINHNSKYILTDTKIDNKKVEVDENIVDFQNSNKTNIAIILVSVLIIIAVIVFILLMNKKNKKD